MKKILEGKWGDHLDTAWEFYIASELPADIEASAVMGIAFCGEKIALTQTKRGWEIPGGHVEPGESILECLYRELKEEIGASDISSINLFGYRKITNPDRKVFATEGKRYPRHTIVPYYFVELATEPSGPEADDCFDARLFDLSDQEVKQSHDNELITYALAER
jgi:8-oxo-dGTP diphosphatase